MSLLEVFVEKTLFKECTTVIMVPEKALEEAGYIQMLSEKHDSASKHEFHAMAQMAYYQYQDDELDTETVNGELSVRSSEKTDVLNKGVLICRSKEGGLSVVAGDGLKVKKFLEAAHRFCTRWVRLDI